ncbi:MAG: hypothetical protein HKP19_09615 [Xanthomonadales bacterium]|nr:hypothetical protein [Xanthomonadales bacterium]
MNAYAACVHGGRAVVVYTPATRRLHADHWPEIRESLTRHVSITAEIEAGTPGSVKSALEASQPDLVVAAGGDGTINLCVRAMNEGDLLAVFPLGTANDLHRSLGKPSGLALRIDRIGVNGQSFCTTGGLGIPSTVAREVNRLRQNRCEWLSRKMGRYIYPLIAANQVLWGGARNQWVEIEWEDVDSSKTRNLRLQTKALFVSNQATFAGSLTVVREAINDDGHFEICVLNTGSRLRDLMITGHIATAAVQRERDCHVLRAVSARIKTAESMPFFGDGEIILTHRRFDLDIVPRGLTVLHLDWLR